jgi:hypothetical protein
MTTCTSTSREPNAESPSRGTVVPLLRRWIKRSGLIAIGIGCSYGSAARADIAEWNIPRVSGEVGHVLGTGYDTRAREFRDVCVEGDVETIGTATGHLSFNNSESNSSYRSFLNGQIGAEVSLFLASARVEVGYSRLATEKTYERQSVFSHDATGRVARLIHPRLTAVGRQVADTQDLGLVRVKCGDSLVTAVTPGGTLLLSATFSFADAATKETANATARASIAMISHEWTFEKESEEVRTTSSVTISGLQLGGTPRALEAVLARARIRTCSLANVTACASAAQELLDYRNGPGGFESQLNELEYRGADTSVLSYQLKSYASFGLTELSQPPSGFEQEAVRTRLDHLAALSMDAVQGDERAELLLAGHGRAEQRADWSSFRDQARSNYLRIQNATDSCFARPARCLEVSKDIESTLGVLDGSRLERHLSTYDYCHSARPPDSDRLALGALAKTVSVNIDDHSDASCTRLEDALDRVHDLDLRGAGLTNIRALSGIRNLRTLVLRDNKIENVAPLESLSGLEALDISYNNVATLAPLLTVTSLRDIYARNNALKHLDNIEDMTSLERLSLEGNVSLGDYTPPKPFPRLISLSRNAAERCAGERRRAFEHGDISAELLAAYEQRNWAPVFERNGIDVGKIVTWAYCPAADATY